MNTRNQVLLWAAQRASAAVLAFCVIVHLITMIYAVRNGLTAAEILSRTRGSHAWLVFYTLFVFAVAVHAPIGLRNILSETFDWRGLALDGFVLAVGIALLASGLRATWTVFA